MLSRLRLYLVNSFRMALAVLCALGVFHSCVQTWPVRRASFWLIHAEQVWEWRHAQGYDVITIGRQYYCGDIAVIFECTVVFNMRVNAPSVRDTFSQMKTSVVSWALHWCVSSFSAYIYSFIGKVLAMPIGQQSWVRSRRKDDWRQLFTM